MRKGKIKETIATIPCKIAPERIRLNNSTTREIAVNAIKKTRIRITPAGI